MSSRLKSSRFTLIEVVIAVAILGMGLVSALGMAASVSRRMQRAMNRWERQHMISQAAEYFLLVGPEGNLPEDIFPYEDYSATCEVSEPEGFEDAELEFEYDDWKLVKFTITLTDDNGDEVEKLEIDKIIKSEGE